ncbi:MAG: hypothetical protein DMF95_05650 [Acidobacteria bacterium]|nr:MAG: hypothetical protein DMF95_05650 [Acidobacteriota bacterium]
MNIREGMRVLILSDAAGRGVHRRAHGHSRSKSDSGSAFVEPAAATAVVRRDARWRRRHRRQRLGERLACRGDGQAGGENRRRGLHVGGQRVLQRDCRRFQQLLRTAMGRVQEYWHHPLFTSGPSAGSNAIMRSIWSLLYDYGVDVVINGHDHLYERFAPQDVNGRRDNFGIQEYASAPAARRCTSSGRSCRTASTGTIVSTAC